MTVARVLGSALAGACVALLTFIPPQAAYAQAAPEQQAPRVPAPREFVTHHVVTLDGKRIAFTATAGETYLYNDSGNPIASIFSYAYVQDGARSSERPVVFVTGGGPGSGSQFLQVGLLGPWAIPLGRLAPAPGRMPSVVPPFDLADNSNSILDVADLVFIDPVGTGYSHVIGTGRGDEFWGIDQDLDSLAQFIQLWLSTNGRWSSAKFFLGESYGGTRAALLPAVLLGGPTYPGYQRGITLNGVIVLANSLGAALGCKGIGPTMLAATELPNEAATAWYYHKADRHGLTFQAFYAQVSRFAVTDYATALAEDAEGTLTPDKRAAIISKLTDYTGVPAAAFGKKLSLTGAEFSQVILADRGLDVGLYDSRFTFPHGGVGDDPVMDDAALARTMPVFDGAFLEMEHHELKVDMERPFAAIRWRGLLTKWQMTRRAWFLAPPRHPSTNAEDLAWAMNRDEQLYALVATGYYDLLFPPAQAAYATGRAPFPKGRLILKAYKAGHDLYVGDAATALARDIRDFIRKAAR